MGSLTLKIILITDILGQKTNISGNDALIEVFFAIIISVNKDLRSHEFIEQSIPNSIKILFSLSLHKQIVFLI